MRKVALMVLVLCGLVYVSGKEGTAVAGRWQTEGMPQALGDTTRVSVDDNGVQGNDDSTAPDVSADGRYVTFVSASDNLVVGDNNGSTDIFVRDRETGDTERVSEDSSGVEGNFDSFAPAISGDGRYVTFCSYATNLVPGDNNGVPDVFVNDRQTGATSLVSRDIFSGFGDDLSCYFHPNSPRQPSGPDISADGRYIVFSSFASDLIGNDKNNSSDIFRFDRQSGTMVRMSVDRNGAEANDDSYHPAISGDGARIVFESDASNLVAGDGNNYRDVFIRNLASNSTDLMSVTPGGGPGNGDSFEPDISADGIFVVFSSFATDLIAGDDNNYLDVFIRDRNPDVTTLVSVSEGGAQPNVFAQTMEPAVSGNGRFVVFQSYANNLANVEVETRDVLVRDRQQGTTYYASVSSGGELGNESSREPVISDDGFFVSFSSQASNLVPNDTNNDRDVFVHQIQEVVPPSPTLSSNYYNGAPGSDFAYTGNHYGQNQLVQIFVNGQKVGELQSASDGTIAFRLDTPSSAQLGVYFVQAIVNQYTVTTGFILETSAPVRPESGSGPIFQVPNNIAYTERLLLPILTRP